MACDDAYVVVLGDGTQICVTDPHACIEGQMFPVGGVPTDVSACSVIVRLDGSIIDVRADAEPAPVDAPAQDTPSNTVAVTGDSGGLHLPSLPNVSGLAPFAGVVVLAGFGLAVWRHIRSEDRDLRRGARVIVGASGRIPHSERDPNRGFTDDDTGYVLRRAGHRCEWVDIATGRRCNERHDPRRSGWLRKRTTGGLQIDHIVPWSHGGPSCIGPGECDRADHGPRFVGHDDNAAALCRHHNLFKSDHPVSADWVQAVRANRGPVAKIRNVIEAVAG